MSTHLAFLRAVNVGGTGKLPMAELKAMAAGLGFENPRTYIASGNLVFDSRLAQAKVQAQLEKALAAYAGKPVGVLMRSPDELRELLTHNPFPEGAPNQVFVNLLPEAPAQALVAKGQQDEQWQLIGRELWIHCPRGAGQSKLRIVGAEAATARNLNTLRAMLELAA